MQRHVLPIKMEVGLVRCQHCRVVVSHALGICHQGSRVDVQYGAFPHNIQRRRRGHAIEEAHVKLLRKSGDPALVAPSRDQKQGLNLERLEQPNLEQYSLIGRAFKGHTKSQTHWPGQSDTGEWSGVSTAMIVAVYSY